MAGVGDAVVVLDNGGCTCKVGYAGQAEPTKVVPNCSAKPRGERQAYLADALLSATDISQLSLRRPIDRGFVVNWGLQRDVWGRCFGKLLRLDDPRACGGLLLSEPALNLPNARDAMYQVVFEEYGFPSFHASPSALWAAHLYTAAPATASAAAAAPAGAGATAAAAAGARDCSTVLLYDQQQQQQEGGGMPAPPPCAYSPACMVVDAGFSATTAAPMFDGVLLEGCVRRINVGGKLLTNYLKELASFRSVNVMDEPLLVERIKETVCFVSADVRADLAEAARGARSPHRREYVLPDGLHSTWGRLREPGEPRPPPPGPPQPGMPPQGPREQVLVLNSERFMVPEVLLNPSDLGLNQAGLAEAVAAAVAAAPEGLHGLLWANVLLTGGTSRLPGLRERLQTELRALAPQEYDVRVLAPQDPVSYAWKGGSALAADPSAWARLATTKARYEEEGAPHRALLA